MVRRSKSSSGPGTNVSRLSRTGTRQRCAERNRGVPLLPGARCAVFAARNCVVGTLGFESLLTNSSTGATSPPRGRQPPPPELDGVRRVPRTAYASDAKPSPALWRSSRASASSRRSTSGRADCRRRCRRARFRVEHPQKQFTPVRVYRGASTRRRGRPSSLTSRCSARTLPAVARVLGPPKATSRRPSTPRRTKRCVSAATSRPVDVVTISLSF